MTEIQKPLYDNQNRKVNQETSAAAVFLADGEGRFNATDLEGALTEVYTQQEAVKKFAYLEAALGNSIQISDTIAAVLAELEIRGGTTRRRLVFSGGNTLDIMDGGNWPFIAGAYITIQECDFAGDNISAVAVTSVSGTRMVFPANTFPTAGCSLSGVITDGTSTVYITLSADHGMTLDSPHNFDLFGSGKNLHRHNYSFPRVGAGVTLDYDATTGEYIFNGTSTGASTFAVLSSGTYLFTAKKGKSYTASIRTTGGTASGPGRVSYYPGIMSATGLVDGGASIVSRTEVMNADTICNYIRLYIPTSGITYTNYRVKVQIEQSAAVTDWEMPLPSITSLPTNIALKDTLGTDLYLRGIGTYDVNGNFVPIVQDVVFRDSDGLWKLRPDIIKATLINSYNYIFYASYTNETTAVFYLGINTLSTAALCGRFKAGTYTVDGTEEAFGIPSTKNRVYFKILKSRLAGWSDALTDAEKVNLFKVYLTANQTELIYVNGGIVTPIELHADCQSALSAAAKSYQNVTNIQSSESLAQIYAVAAKNPAILATKAEVALKANSAQEAWTTPTLLNGATGTIQYRKNNFGKLEFKGTATISSPSAALTLASGYRPSEEINIPISASDGTINNMKIATSGNVTFSATSKTYSLNGIAAVL